VGHCVVALAGRHRSSCAITGCENDMEYMCSAEPARFLIGIDRSQHRLSQTDRVNLLLAHRPRAAGGFKNEYTYEARDYRNPDESMSKATCKDPDATLCEWTIEADTRAATYVPTVHFAGDASRAARPLLLSYHMKHFEQLWKTRQDDGKPVHAACVNLGMERSTLSLFRHRRLDANARVAEMRELLQGDARSRMNPRPASLGASA